MKIGIIGTIWLNTPPEKYGGTEEVIYNLVNGLVERGHDVTFFGPQTAKLKSKVYGTVKEPLIAGGFGWENLAWTINHLSQAFEEQDAFDILHFHLNKHQDYTGLPLFANARRPVLTTLHFQLAGIEKRLPDYHALLRRFAHLPFSSISDFQRSTVPLNFVQTVYNSINLENFPFQKEPEDYFAWIGKIKPEKGTKEAILIAKEAGVKLRLIGPVDQGVPSNKEYFAKEVEPLIDGKQIIWEGELSTREKANVLGNAKAFLNPLQWEEPFGLVMIESQAVGTPVIAFRRGAAPELIEDGKTGFIVASGTEMVKRIQEIDTIDRAACRAHIEKNFTPVQMVMGYEKAYKEAQALWGKVQKRNKGGKRSSTGALTRFLRK